MPRYLRIASAITLFLITGLVLEAQPRPDSTLNPINPTGAIDPGDLGGEGHKNSGVDPQPGYDADPDAMKEQHEQMLIRANNSAGVNPDEEMPAISPVTPSAQYRYTPPEIGKIGMELLEFELDNGLKVYLVEDHNRPTVYGSVVVKAGGKYDPKDATGMGHYLEHMLFKGTTWMGTSNYLSEKIVLERIDSLYEELGKLEDEKERAALQLKINEASVEAAQYAIPNEFTQLVQSIGGTGLNAFTTEEMIVYHNSFPPNQIDNWLKLYTDRFSDPVFRLFQSELETVYEEKNRASDNFGYQVFREYYRQFYKKHPYGQQDVLGETEHLRNPSLVKMKKYFDDFYVANNMALVLVGDFRTEEVMASIKASFGQLKQGDVPGIANYKEEEFKGREFVKKRLSPISIGIIGYRTVPHGHPDKAAIDVCSYLLSNSNQTGYIDQLMLDKELMAVGAELDVKNDYGGLHIFFVPKIIGQSLGKAEKKVSNSIEMLSSGQFTAQDLSIAIANLKKEFIERHENPFGRGYALATVFAADEKWQKHLRYVRDLDSLTYEKITEVAAKYFGKNRLVFYSKTGFPKKDKLPDPGYEAPIPKTGVKSDYAKEFELTATQEPMRKFVHVGTDVQTTRINENLLLYYTPNPVNDIFSLDFEICKGSDKEAILDLVPGYLQLCGSMTTPSKELKRKLSEYGASYWVEDRGHSIQIHVTGFDQKIEQILREMSAFIFNPQMDMEILDQVKNQIKAERKIESKDPQTLGGVLYEFAAYGERSGYVNRLDKKALKQLEIGDLDSAYKDAVKNMCSIRYAGRVKKEILQEKLRQHFGQDLAKYEKIEKFEARKKVNPAATKILFMHNKKARQSQIYFYQNLGPEKTTEVAARKAFNRYFGGDMSSLVFQEIREFRSLAYAARAVAMDPLTEADDVILKGYVGSQADKTTTAVEVMMNLIGEMPAKKERVENVRKSLVNSISEGFPSFRQRNAKLVSWHRRGFLGDPNKMALNTFLEMDYKLINDFYNEQVKDAPVIIAITGNKKHIDMDELEKWGEIEVVKLKDISTK